VARDIGDPTPEITEQVGEDGFGQREGLLVPRIVLGHTKAKTTTDQELSREIAARGWVFVTQDKKIRSRAAARRALVAFGLRTFSVASTANLSAEDTITALRAAKAKIDETLANDTGPFVYGVRKDGTLHRLPVDS
jgi:PIN like domain